MGAKSIPKVYLSSFLRNLKIPEGLWILVGAGGIEPTTR